MLPPSSFKLKYLKMLAAALDGGGESEVLEEVYDEIGRLMHAPQVRVPHYARG